MSPTYGKQFSGLYDEVSKDCGDVTASFITEIKKKINDVGRSIFNEMNYAWKQRVADLTLVASQQYLNMADIAADWDDMTPVEIFYRDAAQNRWVLDPYSDIEWRDKEDLDEGDPFGYHISKASGAWRILFTYVPTSAFISSYVPLKMEYMIKWTELSADADIPDIPTSHHQLLLYRADEIVCGIMGDTEAAVGWKKLADKEQGRLNKKQVNRLGRPHRVYPGASILGGRTRKPRDYNL